MIPVERPFSLNPSIDVRSPLARADGCRGIAALVLRASAMLEKFV
jgi:hypothetical protein